MKTVAKNKTFILASKSPRRKELLYSIGIKAEIIPSNVDESKVIGLSPEKMVTELAMLKTTDVARSFRGDTIVIGADTCVCIEGRILGKPQNIEDAKNMLSSLSGRTHEVYTGYCVCDCKSGVCISKCEKTLVTFKTLTEDEISLYVKTREPMDKAGAYGIQGKGAVFVEKIDGDYANVVGLPLCALSKLLNEEFNVDIF